MVLLTIKTSLPNARYYQKRDPRDEQTHRTGEYVLLFGFVFVAAVVTMAIIGPQITRLIAASAGL